MLPLCIAAGYNGASGEEKTRKSRRKSEWLYELNAEIVKKHPDKFVAYCGATKYLGKPQITVGDKKEKEDMGNAKNTSYVSYS